MISLSLPTRSTIRWTVVCLIFIFSFPSQTTTSFGISSSTSTSISTFTFTFTSKSSSPRQSLQLPFSPSEYNNNNNMNYISSNNNATKFDSALAIVPPLPDWDRLQRARHFARDALFHQWPPAIRLFHPFRGTALEVAQAIEELELEAFELTFDTWVIVPHLEAVEEDWRTSASAPYVEETEYYDPQQVEEDEAVRKLIEREEQIGLEKAKAREAKKSSSQEDLDTNSNIHIHSNMDLQMDNTNSDAYENHEDDDDNDYDEDNDDTISRKNHNNKNKNNNNSNGVRDDPSRIFRRQQEQLDDFGGPSLLCLEPNLESKQLLQDLRDELALLLNLESDYFSPSSIYSYKYIMEPMFRPDDYRPLIPIGAFESLQAALQVARRLKGLWGDPLTFEVKDLHLLSCREEDEYLGDEWTLEPWGCNAKIMLVGEERQQDDMDDDDYDEDVDIAQKIKLLLEKGQAGGNDISKDYTILEDEEEISDLEMWLNNDDDFDEGMQVVIGRTHFYTGDQRYYKGMPASSVMDSRDKSLGDVGSVSGLARRRRTNTRSGNNQWEDGEYGRRQSDYLPWTKREKPKKVERLLDLPAEYDRAREKEDDDNNNDNGNDKE